MQRFFGPYAAYSYAVFRIVAGGMFLLHGTQKLFGFPAAPPMPVNGLMWTAGAIELVCGALILLGLFGSVAGFIAAGEMAVAYFMVHARGGLWPIVNQGELAVLYCFAFLYIAAAGSGVWSVDAMRTRKLPAGDVREIRRVA
jgi:putative oxidoreductase